MNRCRLFRPPWDHETPQFGQWGSFFVSLEPGDRTLGCGA